MEYDPATGLGQGWLLETTQRVNKAFTSEDFSGNWNVFQCTRAISTFFGSNASTAMSLVTAAAATGHIETYTGTLNAITAGATHMVACDVKKGNWNFGYINLTENVVSGKWITCVFDFTSGVPVVSQMQTGSVGGTVVGSQIVKDLGDGVYRITFFCSLPVGVTNTLLIMGLASAASGFGQGGSGDNVIPDTAHTWAGTENMYFQSPMVSEGTTDTSHIITTADADVIRSADLPSTTDAGLLAADAWIVEAGEVTGVGTSASLIGINTTIGIARSTGDALTTSDGGTQTTVNTGTWSGWNRGGLAWDGGSARVTIDLDGGSIVTAANTAVTPTVIYFGTTNNGASDFFNGHLRSFAAYTTVLDADLPALTTVGAPFSIAATPANVGSAAGAGAAIGVGASIAAGVGSAAGSGAATAVGSSIAAAVGSAAGSGAATATGVALFSGIGSAAGSGAAAAIGASLAKGVGSAAGAGVASGIGRSTAASVGSAAGSGAASGVGASTALATGSAAGSGAATATGKALATGVGSAAGAGTATGVAFTGASIGTAAGAGTATGVGRSIVTAVGTAAGGATVTAVGASLATGIGSAAGAGSAQSVGASTAVAIGVAAGSSTAAAVSSGVIPVVGTIWHVETVQSAFSHDFSPSDFSNDFALSSLWKTATPALATPSIWKTTEGQPTAISHDFSGDFGSDFALASIWKMAA